MTELLCKMLEERGLSCQTHYLHVSWRVGSKLYDAVDNLDGTLTVDNLTPEQAIAATLGVSRCRDCEHIVKTSNPMTTSGYWCVENDNPRGLDGFCDYFERRKGEIEEVG